MEKQDFWQKTAKTFMEYEDLIRDLKFPDKLDIELYRLSAKIPEFFDYKFDSFYYAQLEKDMVLIVPHLAALNLPLPPEYQNHFLFRPRSPSVRDIIEKSISQKELNEEFVEAWGQYNFSIAALIGFMSRKDVSYHEIGNVKKNIGNIIGHYVFAFWMHKHWVEGVMKKEEARDILADHIGEILESETDIPDWKKSALKEMLAKDDSGITKTYTEWSETDIRQMVKLAEHLRHLIEI